MPACTLNQIHGTTNIQLGLFAEKGVEPNGAVFPDGFVGHTFNNQVGAFVKFGDEAGQHSHCSLSKLFLPCLT